MPAGGSTARALPKPARTRWLDQGDGVARATLHAGSAATASLPVNFDGSCPQGNRLAGTDRLASSAERAGFFINAGDLVCVAGLYRGLARPDGAKLPPPGRRLIPRPIACSPLRGRRRRRGRSRFRNRPDPAALAAPPKLATPLGSALAAAPSLAGPAAHASAPPATAAPGRSCPITSRHDQSSYSWAVSRSASRFLISARARSKCSACALSD